MAQLRWGLDCTRALVALLGSVFFLLKIILRRLAADHFAQVGGHYRPQLRLTVHWLLLVVQFLALVRLIDNTRVRSSTPCWIVLARKALASLGSCRELGLARAWRNHIRSAVPVSGFGVASACQRGLCWTLGAFSLFVLNRCGE